MMKRLCTATIVGLTLSMAATALKADDRHRAKYRSMAPHGSSASKRCHIEVSYDWRGAMLRKKVCPTKPHHGYAYHAPVTAPKPPPVAVFKHPPRKAYRSPPYRSAPAPAATPRYAGDYCREYSSISKINGELVESYGTACRQPDGRWRIMRVE